MIKYSGETIKFALHLIKGDNPNIDGFDDLDEVDVYLYTDACTIAKFKYLTSGSVPVGYGILTLLDNLRLEGVILPQQSKLLKTGILIVEVKAKKSGEYVIDKKNSGACICNDFIKAE